MLELRRFWGPLPRSVLTLACNIRYQEHQQTMMAALPQQSFSDQKLADTTYPYGLFSGRVIHMETDESYTSFCIRSPCKPVSRPSGKPKILSNVKIFEGYCRQFRLCCSKRYSVRTICAHSSPEGWPGFTARKIERTHRRW